MEISHEIGSSLFELLNLINGGSTLTFFFQMLRNQLLSKLLPPKNVVVACPALVSKNLSEIQYCYKAQVLRIHKCLHRIQIHKRRGTWIHMVVQKTPS